jgi:DNA-binding MurR/RpiR family transcriptional regulator
MGVHLLQAAFDALLTADSQVDRAVFDQTVAAIHHARRVLIAGSWGEREEFGQLFSSVGVVAEAPMSVPSQLAAARILDPRSVCIVVCQSGETPGSLEVAYAAQETRATVVVLTSSPRSTISQLGDTVMCVRSASNSVFSPLADHLALTGVVYAIFAAVARLRQVKGSAASSLTARTASR